MTTEPTAVEVLAETASAIEENRAIRRADATAAAIRTVLADLDARTAERDEAVKGFHAADEARLDHEYDLADAKAQIGKLTTDLETMTEQRDVESRGAQQMRDDLDDLVTNGYLRSVPRDLRNSGPVTAVLAELRRLTAELTDAQRTVSQWEEHTTPEHRLAVVNAKLTDQLAKVIVEREAERDATEERIAELGRAAQNRASRMTQLDTELADAKDENRRLRDQLRHADNRIAQLADDEPTRPPLDPARVAATLDLRPLVAYRMAKHEVAADAPYGAIEKLAAQILATSPAGGTDILPTALELVDAYEAAQKAAAGTTDSGAHPAEALNTAGQPRGIPHIDDHGICRCTAPCCESPDRTGCCICTSCTSRWHNHTRRDSQQDGVRV